MICRVQIGREFRADEGARILLDGSPRVALEVEPPLHAIFFSTLIRVFQGTCIPKGSRNTIAGLANTGAIEGFLNFPVGMSIQRLLMRNGKFTERQRRKLDEYFGDPGWFDIVYPKSPGLFGQEQEKAADAGERLVNWYRERLRTAFGYVSNAYLVRNSKGGHLYFLIFAGPNKTGAKIANYILSAGRKSVG